MKLRRIATVTAAGSLFVIAALAIISPTKAQKASRISDVLDLRQDSSVVAVLPELKAFVNGLREGASMRAFFDSPLGLHFIKSAPFRSAAHLHRMISLAPKSWQWNLYATISAGPVFYRSSAKSFTLAFKLNTKGKVLTSLISSAHAKKVEDWFVIASDGETLKAAVSYLAAPIVTESPLDAKLNQPGALIVSLQPSKQSSGLARTLISEFTGIDSNSSCVFSFLPAGDAIGIDGDCKTKGAAALPVKNESLSGVNYPFYAYFRKPGAKVAHVVALDGFTSDYGYVIPKMFYSGPASDSKSIEFLSQVFKTRNHIAENKNGGLQILFPRSYSSRNNKYEIFAPFLSANSDRFFWHSLTSENKKGSGLNIDASFAWYTAFKPYAFIKNSEDALKQFEPIYSPGHFFEFRDALLKSLPTLKNAIFTAYAKSSANSLKIGGSLQFAEN